MTNRPSLLRIVRPAFVAITVLVMLQSAAHATGDPPMVLQEMLGQAMSRGTIIYPTY